MKDNKRISAVVFSKDRALQLKAVFDSFFARCQDSELVEMTVLYKCTDIFHQNQYNTLQSQYSQVRFLPETNFRLQLIELMRQREYVLFIVDDIMFVQDFNVSKVLSAIEANPRSIGFSLRLGLNNTYCYMKSRDQRVPQCERLAEGVLKYQWKPEECDFGYPLEVSTSIYRSNHMYNLFSQIDFKNPNTLESMMDCCKQAFNEFPELLMYEKSPSFGNPVNLVQTVKQDNKYAKDMSYSTQNLLELFEKGYSIDVERFYGFVPKGVQQEAEYNFTGENPAQPLVTVMMVTYNTERFIREAIESVLAQTYHNYELLIIDDGSTDNTKSIVQSYTDRRIRYVYQQHHSFAAGMNRAIDESQGELLIGVDADDFVSPDYLAKLVDASLKYPDVDYFYPKALMLVKEDSQLTGNAYAYEDFSDNRRLPEFLFNNGFGPIPNSGSLKRKRIYNSLGLYDLLGTIEDFAFLAKNALKIRFMRVDDCGNYFYRRLSSGNCHKFKARNQIASVVLAKMVQQYPPEVLNHKAKGYSANDPEYLSYVADIFNAQSQKHLNNHGEYFSEFANKYAHLADISKQRNTKRLEQKPASVSEIQNSNNANIATMPHLKNMKKSENPVNDFMSDARPLRHKKAISAVAQYRKSALQLSDFLGPQWTFSERTLLRTDNFSKPQISIVMRNYNRPYLITHAIKSVLVQTMPDWELIIVDDCSTDNSLDVIKPYLADSRIKLVQHETNKGNTPAMNTGIAHVTADIFGILDSDDALCYNALEIMVDAHKKHPQAGYIYSDFVYCDGHLFPRSMRGNCPIPNGQTSVEHELISHFNTFKKCFYDQTDGYDETLTFAEDKDIIYRMEEIAPFVCIQQPLYLYRELPDSVSHVPLNEGICILARGRAKLNALIRRNRATTYQQIITVILDASQRFPEIKSYIDVIHQLINNGIMGRSNGKTVEQIAVEIPFNTVSELIKQASSDKKMHNNMHLDTFKSNRITQSVDNNNRVLQNR